MPHADAENKNNIDVVVTWVDGSTLKQTQKRQKYLANATRTLHENAINPHRWASNDEILFCLQSIYNFAPWVRKIWIVVDDETPDISSLPETLQEKISFVFHKEIYKEFSSNLPTFNSVSIETLLWRIAGLTEKFIYFNDDVFLTAPLLPSDVFDGCNPVLRGKWIDYSSIVNDKNSMEDPAKFHNYMQINAANIVGYNASRVFNAAHVIHPFQSSKMSELFSFYRNNFLQNLTYQFRDLDQFSPQALYNHSCILKKQAVLKSTQDHLHVYSGQERDSSPEEIESLLERALNSPDIKFLCINDLPKLEQVIPDVKNWVAKIIGGFDKPLSFQ